MVSFQKICNFLLLVSAILIFESSSSDGNLFRNFFRRIFGSRSQDRSRSEDESRTEDTRITCKDENGNGVPWYIVYKLPKLKTASVSSFRQGLGYSYILPGYKEWRPSSKPISNQNSIVGHTLRPFFDTPSDIMSILYNDQPPEERSNGYGGHSKGIVLSKESGGIWLAHSVPKFPWPGSNFYPSNGLVNGQMFLCLTLSPNQVDGIGDIFRLTRPNVMNSSIPSPLSKKFPKLKKFLASKRFKGRFNASFPLTVGELNFNVFAKSPKFKKEIYMDWLAPSLQSDLDVQSWRRGRGILTSNCSSHSYKVYNIADKQVGMNEFSRNDHSKWAVRTKVGTGDPWICISDLNRMRGQKSRGGVTFCASDSLLWRTFTSTVVALQPCMRHTQ